MHYLLTWVQHSTAGNKLQRESIAPAECGQLGVVGWHGLAWDRIHAVNTFQAGPKCKYTSNTMNDAQDCICTCSMVIKLSLFNGFNSIIAVPNINA